MFRTDEAGFQAARQATVAFWQAAANAQAAGVTIALRLPILAQAAFDPFAWPARREALRAATEKWEAAAEGALAAGFAAAAVWRNLVFRPGDMKALARSVGAVSAAAVRPAGRRARGNARRLSKR